MMMMMIMMMMTTTMHNNPCKHVYVTGAESPLHIFSDILESLKKKYVRFQFLTAASMNIAVFWVVEPCTRLPDYTAQQPRR
jgi:hypothetical protein